MNKTLKGKINYNKLTGKLNVGKEYIKPTGTIDITSNGTFDVADYGKANVQLNVEDLEQKIITFVDYDGTLLYEIPLNELDEMPPLPEHDGLICQGWNWTLEQIKNENASFYVGPGYITDDERTRFYVTLAEDDLNLWVSFTRPSGTTMYVDWGDGSEQYTSNESGFISINHIYENTGDYLITFYCPKGTNTTTSGYYKFSGYNGNPGILFCKKQVPAFNTQINVADTAMHIITKIELGERYSLGTSSFSYATNLKAMTTPRGTGIDASGLYMTTSLKTFIWNGAALPQSPFVKSGLETLVTSATFSGHQFYTSNDDTTFGQSLRQCYLPKATKVVPNFSNNCVILKGLPKNLVELHSTKPDDYFDELPNGLISLIGGALIGFKNKRCVIPDSVYCQWASGSGMGTFSENKYVEEIIYPDTVKIVSNWFNFSYTFYKCPNLKRVIYPKNITKVGSFDCQDCTKLEEVRLPEQAKEIGSTAFKNCTSLREVDMPSGITTIYQYAFENCTGLKKDIILPYGLLTIKNNAFSNCPVNITIPSTVTAIDASCFKNCKNLTGPVDLSNVTNMNLSYVFQDCSKLSSVSLSKTATSIGSYYFYGCKSLSYVYIPSNIVTIGSSVFAYGGDQIEQTFDFRDHTKVPSVQTGSFTKSSGLTIVVPDELYDTWITTGNWTGFATYIIKASEYAE